MTNPQSVIKDKKLDLPPVNTLIPKNFDLLPANEELSKELVMVKKWENGMLWYMKDDKFKKPKANVALNLYTTDNDFSTKKEGRMFAGIWKEVLNEYLGEFKYMAECANLEFEATITADHVEFIWQGFNDSMTNFITETV